MNKNEISIFSKVELVEGKNWQEIVNDKDFVETMLKVKTIGNTDFDTIEEYELQQNDLLIYQRQVNKYVAENITPVKKILNHFKNEVVLKKEKETAGFLKELKKIKKQQAIDKGIIFEEIEVEKPKEQSELQKIINTELEWLEKHKNETRSNEYLQMIFTKMNKLID